MHNTKYQCHNIMSAGCSVEQTIIRTPPQNKQNKQTKNNKQTKLKQNEKTSCDKTERATELDDRKGESNDNPEISHRRWTSHRHLRSPSVVRGVGGHCIPVVNGPMRRASWSEQRALNGGHQLVQMIHCMFCPWAIRLSSFAPVA